MVWDRSKLLKWMLARFRPREFDSNKQYTAELLAILLQSSQKNQQKLADANGIDVLLQASSCEALELLGLPRSRGYTVALGVESSVGV